VTTGRKPKPIEQRAREGNPGKRRLPEPVVVERTGKLKRPAGMPEAANELWDEIVGPLENAGILHPIDRAALQAMCLEWAVSEKARQAIEYDGIFARGGLGQLVEHPALTTLRQSHAVFLRIASEYGLTAVARVRIAAALTGGGDGGELAGILDAASARF
jgi:P27 family predicted phage terminase small subunit